MKEKIRYKGSMILALGKMPGDLYQLPNIKQFLTGKTESIPSISKMSLHKLFKDGKEENTYHFCFFSK